MTTAIEIINDALREISVLAQNQTATNQQAVQALDQLNKLISRWELDGISIGVLNLDLTTTIPLPDNHIDVLVMNLAVKLCASYGKIPKPTTKEDADGGYTALQAAYGNPIDMTIDAAIRIPRYFPTGRPF